MKILLTGKDGQLGIDLVRRLATRAQVVALGRQELDLEKPAMIRRIIRSIHPDLIINAAAYTAVDQAEADQARALAINGGAPGVLAEEARSIRAGFIHYSTDYVFDGTKHTPYVETDQPSPLNAYGRSKLAGEVAVQSAGGAYLILRTSWVYAAHGRNFLQTMLRLGAERRSIRIVDDQIGAPTWSGALADTTVSLIMQREMIFRYPGIYHVSGAGQTSWYGFAQKIFEMAPGVCPGLQGGVSLQPIRSVDYPTPAQRPGHSVLSNHLLGETFGLYLPHWEASLYSCLQYMKAARG